MKIINKIMKKVHNRLEKESKEVGKTLIFGTDAGALKILEDCFNGELEQSGIIGFVDNEVNCDKIWDLPVYCLNNISVSYDRIIIMDENNYSTLSNQLYFGYGIPKYKIMKRNYLLYLRIIWKYRDSKDPEIKQTIANITGKTYFDYWCDYCPKAGKLYPIYWDKERNMPYTFYYEKKMYFPRNKKFILEEGKQYVRGLEFEQQEGSPHTYITEKNEIKKGDVLIDAGVCEGNFALKYIDRVSKVYLIECDPDWIYPLQLTFEPYADKVVFCTKFLGKNNSESTVSLDTLIGTDKVDFIKMDIEGAEVDALLGGKSVFQNNNLKCAICSYHKHDDEKKIKQLLVEYGYAVTTSRGYMIFHGDSERFKYSELRRGVVYGIKENSYNNKIQSVN